MCLRLSNADGQADNKPMVAQRILFPVAAHAGAEPWEHIPLPDQRAVYGR